MARTKCFNNLVRHHIRRDPKFATALLRESVRAARSPRATRNILARKLLALMKSEKLSRMALARQMKTSRSQLEHLLNPKSSAVTIQTLVRAAHRLGKYLSIELA